MTEENPLLVYIGDRPDTRILAAAEALLAWRRRHLAAGGAMPPAATRAVDSLIDHIRDMAFKTQQILDHIEGL